MSRTALRGTAIARAAAAVISTAPLAGCGLLGTGTGIAAPAVMTVGSASFIQGGLPARYTCRARAAAPASPPITWSGAPLGTKSFALVVDDSDAPITPFIYWIVYGISPDTTDIPERGLPPGAKQAVNSAGRAAYDPPCPAPGQSHRYRFTVYALKTMPDLKQGASLQTAWSAIADATIGRGRITVTAK